MNLPTIIICVILVIIICIGIRSTKKRATSGCCGGSETIKKVKVKDRKKEHYPYMTFTVKTVFVPLKMHLIAKKAFMPK